MNEVQQLWCSFCCVPVSGKDHPIADQGSLQLSEHAVMGNDVSVGFGAWLPALCKPALQAYEPGRAKL